MKMGAAPKGVDPYARNNLWQLYTALSLRPESSPERVHFICLWSRKEGDGPGGTKDMYDQISKHLGQAYVLDTNELFLKSKIGIYATKGSRTISVVSYDKHLG